jgi:murein DD-endopeptidase MepM/ murein hydrolase activator NlpD
MPRFELFYPVYPHVITQKWGIINDLYRRFGFSLHNGQDLRLTLSQAIRAPFDCEVVRVGYHPEGAGRFIGLLSKNTYRFEDGQECRVLVDLMHCEKIFALEGEDLRVGNLIALGGSTGLSTAPHTHIQCRRVREEKIAGRSILNYRLTVNGMAYFDIDRNEANNSFDPAPYYNGVYAKDAEMVFVSIPAMLADLKEKVKSFFRRKGQKPF